MFARIDEPEGKLFLIFFFTSFQLPRLTSEWHPGLNFSHVPLDIFSTLVINVSRPSCGSKLKFLSQTNFNSCCRGYRGDLKPEHQPQQPAWGVDFTWRTTRHVLVVHWLWARNLHFSITYIHRTLQFYSYIYSEGFLQRDLLIYIMCSLISRTLYSSNVQISVPDFGL